MFRGVDPETWRERKKTKNDLSIRIPLRVNLRIHMDMEMPNRATPTDMEMTTSRHVLADGIHAQPDEDL